MNLEVVICEAIEAKVEEHLNLIDLLRDKQVKYNTAMAKMQALIHQEIYKDGYTKGLDKALKVVANTSLLSPQQKKALWKELRALR